MATYVTKRVGRKNTTVLQPIGFTAQPNASGNAVTLMPVGKQTFSKGGQITLIAGGLTSIRGASLAGRTMFNISKGGKSISWREPGNAGYSGGRLCVSGPTRSRTAGAIATIGRHSP